MIIDREKEINSFIPEEYWTIEGQFEKDKKAFDALYYGNDKEKVKLSNEEEVKEVLNIMKGNKFEVTNVVKKERKRNPAPSFTTSSLQQEAARKLKLQC